MAISTTGAWRAFSPLVQTAPTAAQNVFSSFYFDGDPLSASVAQYANNKGHAVGELLPTDAQVLTRELKGAHKAPWLTPHIAGLIASMVMGKCTTALIATTTAYKHKIELDKTVLDVPLRTMIENDGGAQFLYTGVAAAGFTISGKRGDFAEFDCELLGLGNETADATAKPARTVEPYLRFGDLKLYRGGAYDGTAVTGATEMSAVVTDMKLSVKNGAKLVYQAGVQSGNASVVRRAEKVDVDLEVGFEVTDQTHQTALLNGTEYVLWLPIVGGVANGSANYTVEIIVPRARYMEAKKTKKDGVHVAAKFDVLHDATYGGPIINVINLYNKSYLANA
jgi:hypothetical protein